MELNENEINYIINLLELDGRIINNNIKKVMDYRKEAAELKERFNFVVGIIDKLKEC